MLTQFFEFINSFKEFLTLRATVFPFKYHAKFSINSKSFQKKKSNVMSLANNNFLKNLAQPSLTEPELEKDKNIQLKK